MEMKKTFISCALIGLLLVSTVFSAETLRDLSSKEPASKTVANLLLDQPLSRVAPLFTGIRRLLRQRDRMRLLELRIQERARHQRERSRLRTRNRNLGEMLESLDLYE